MSAMPSGKPPSLSIVISFRNEAEVLPELIARLRAVLAAERANGSIESHELVFVNDASDDASEAVLDEHARGHADLRVIHMSRVFGVAPCALAGLEHASGDLVVTMDADLQDPPELIPRLLEVWRSEPEIEVVHTIRTRREGEGWLKLAITRLGYLVLKAVSTVDLPIEAGDFKLLARRAREHVIRFREKRPFLRGLVCWVGFKQRQIEYVREPRSSGTSKFPIVSREVIRNFIDSAFIAFSDVPLKLSIVAGLGVTALAFLYSGWILLSYLRAGAVPAESAVLIAVLLLGGVNLMGIGILGLYISSIFLEVKQRPNYIVRSTSGFGSEPPEARSGVDGRAPGGGL